ncbi:hypothetical protein AB1Y20_011711 [Prymnesium parvum]|uniref:Ubiquitin-like domain-containing protein n=1 Tax=Prymnesium parvum TaxID=97485 RepID=A0AB34II76_PRYPA
MRLFLKVLLHDPPSLQQLSATPEQTVSELLAAVQCDEAAAHLALVREGVELPRSSSLAACGIADAATLHVICTRRTLRLRHASAAPPPARLAARREEMGASPPSGWRGPRPLEEVVPSSTPRALLRPAAPPAPAAAAAASDSDSEEGEEAEEAERQAHARRWPRAPAAAPALLAPRQPWDDEPPDDCLELEWVSGVAPRAGVGVCGGEAVYATGALVVVHSIGARTQRHFHAHRTPVAALALHPAGRVVASAAAVPGEEGEAGEWEVVLWDAPTASVITSLPAPRVRQLAFSPEGDQLACLSRADAALQSLTTWAWQEGRRLSIADLSGGPYSSLLWQRAPTCEQGRIVVLGRRALLLLDAPLLERHESSVCGRVGPPAGRLRALVALRNGMLVSGCRSGELQLWTGPTLLRRTQARVIMEMRAEAG